MYSDPSGMFALAELVTCTSVGEILTKSVGFILLNALKSAVAGAVLGAVDSVLGGNDFTTVVQDTLKGAVCGAILSALISSLVCIGVVFAQAVIALKVLRVVFLAYGLYATKLSYDEGNLKQAVF